ncbi:DUF4174 domain-containing protein [Psychroflexus tropicus]|uniref:DUF4174 domain-containing protein n=1 Tax=Psychroflexus tropicus TaxID=197345 RepID=UPI00037AA4FE|nr:DUF4174 domain-containing protein [Psychroflexus tropicus]
MKLILTIFLFSLMNLTQGFNDKRIIVISSTEINSAVKEQIDRLKKESLQLEERKLAIFTLIDSEVTPIFNANKASKAFVEKNKSRYNSSLSFEMYLVGLDQGVKRTFKELVLPIQIFEIIDSMPMRRAEMNKN